MKNRILEKIDVENRRKDELPAFEVGDTVHVHVRIREGDKDRIQLFTGVVIARDGGGSTATFTVRRIAFGEGVERVFPINSPSIAKLEVESKGRTRRAKLYYLRDRVGKSARLEVVEA